MSHSCLNLMRCFCEKLQVLISSVISCGNTGAIVMLTRNKTRGLLSGNKPKDHAVARKRSKASKRDRRPARSSSLELLPATLAALVASFLSVKDRMCTFALLSQHLRQVTAIRWAWPDTLALKIPAATLKRLSEFLRPRELILDVRAKEWREPMPDLVPALLQMHTLIKVDLVGAPIGCYWRSDDRVADLALEELASVVQKLPSLTDLTCGVWKHRLGDPPLPALSVRPALQRLCLSSSCDVPALNAFLLQLPQLNTLHVSLGHDDARCAYDYEADTVEWDEENDEERPPPHISLLRGLNVHELSLEVVRPSWSQSLDPVREDWWWLTALEQMTKLTSFTFRWDGSGKHPHLLKASHILPHIRSLPLTALSVTGDVDFNQKAINCLQHLSGLTSLTLEHTFHSHTYCHDLSVLSSFHDLRSLSLDNFPLPIVPHLMGATKLTSLDLRHCDTGEKNLHEEVRQLQQSRGVPLQSLTIKTDFWSDIPALRNNV